MKERAPFVQHEPCPECGSKDNLARYADGGAFCFGCEYREKPDDSYELPKDFVPKKDKVFYPLYGEYNALRKRKISEDTCRYFGYQVGTYKGEICQFINVRDADRNLTGQKVRMRDKKFTVLGTVSNEVLIGMHLFSRGRKLVITEGEIDMLSYAEVTNCKYPVVSLPNGAQSAKQVLTNCIKYLENFEEIILLFDDDEAGQKAVIECMPLLPTGRIKSAKINGYKDANEALVDGAIKPLINCVFDAKDYKPSAVVTVDDIFDKAMKLPEMGLSFPWSTATTATLGIRKGEIHIVGAAPKIGKTEYQHQLIKHMTEVHNLKVGVMSLEENPVKTAKKIAGKYMNKQFTKPPEVGGYTPDELKSGLNLLKKKIEFYSSEGVRDYNEILNTIRYWAATGVWFFILDPLTALVAEHDSSSANDILNEFMSKAASMCMELQITIFMFSHVNPPKHGLPHDQGGEVLSSQFTGSRAMEKWAHYGWGIVRDRTQEDAVQRNTGQHVLLFDREFGEYCRYNVYYDSANNEYREVSEADAAGLDVEEF
jgi:twinkle protein